MGKGVNVDSNRLPSEEARGIMDIPAIMQLLPHRYPFLLVDRVLDCQPGKHITGLKNLTCNEPFFCCSEQSGRTMPHLLVVEALAQLAVILTFQTLQIRPTGHELMFFAGIDNARFATPASPGDQIILHSEVKRLRKGLGTYRGRAEVSAGVSAEIDMLAAWKFRMPMEAS